MTDFSKLIFYRTKLKNELLKKRVLDDQDLYYIFKKRIYLNDAIDEEIKSRVDGLIDNFNVFLFLGEQGSMKTSSAMSLMKEKVNPSFSMSGVCFTYADFESRLNTSVSGDCFQIDEMVFQHGTGSIRLINDLQNIIETLRKRRNSMFMCGVTSKFFPESIFHLVFEALDNTIQGTCKDIPELHEVRTCPCNKDKDHVIDCVFVRFIVRKNDKSIGFYVQKVIWNNPMWLEYNNEKVKFMEQAKSNAFDKLDYEGIAEELLNDKELVFYKKNRDLKLYLEKKFPNLANEEKELLIRQIRITREKKEVKLN